MTARKTSVLFVTSDRKPGGIQVALDYYLKALVGMDPIDLTILAPSDSPFLSDESRKAMPQSWQIAPPLTGRDRLLMRHVPWIWSKLKALPHKRYDLAMTHNAFASRALKACADRVIGICHNDKTCRFAPVDDLVVLSTSCADEARNARSNMSGPRLHVVPNPYVCRASTIKPLPETGPLTIGTGARFVPKKALEIFIRVAEIIHRHHPDIRFVIAGTGSEEAELKQLAGSVAPFIDFPGWLSVNQMVERFDLYCQVSREEPFGFLLCEMMDAGLGCCSTATNGPRDILSHGSIAPLCPIDDVDRLAAHVLAMIEQPDHMAEIKAACFQRIRDESFSFDRFTERLKAIIEGP